MLCRRFYLSRMSLFRGFLQSIASQRKISTYRVSAEWRGNVSGVGDSKVLLDRVCSHFVNDDHGTRLCVSAVVSRCFDWVRRRDSIQRRASRVQLGYRKRRFRFHRHYGIHRERRLATPEHNTSLSRHSDNCTGELSHVLPEFVCSPAGHIRTTHALDEYYGSRSRRDIAFYLEVVGSLRSCRDICSRALLHRESKSTGST